MIDEEQPEDGEESQTTSEEGQTDFTPELLVFEHPFEHDVDNEPRTSPLTHTSLESEDNQSLIPTLKRKQTDDSSGSTSESSHSEDDFGSTSDSPDSEESTGVDSDSPSLEAHQNSLLRTLDHYLFNSQDQMLCVTLFELGPNWELVSDVMASVGVYLSPANCKKQHQLYHQLVTREGRLADLPTRNWITREVIEEVQRNVVDSNTEKYVRQISMFHRRRCEKLRALYPREEPLMARVAQNELRKDTIGGRLMNPTEAFTKARKQIVPPSIVLKPYRHTTEFKGSSSSNDNLMKTPQNSKALEVAENLQNQQPLPRQLNLFSDFSDVEATGWHGNGSVSSLGVPSVESDNSSGLGQKPEMSELHNTEDLANSPSTQGNDNFDGTSLIPLNSDFSFDASVLHCLEDLPGTLQFQQLQLDDTGTRSSNSMYFLYHCLFPLEYDEQGQEPKSEPSLDHSVKDSRRDLSQVHQHLTFDKIKPDYRILVSQLI